MHYEQRILDNRLIISIIGEFTFEDHQTFREIINLISESNDSHIQLNLSRLEFVDSAALGMLLIAREEAAAHDKKIVLAQPTATVEKGFHISKFDQLFALES